MKATKTPISTGQRHGNYEVLRRARSSGGNSRWTCRCDCGVIKSVFVSQLRASGRGNKGAHCSECKPAPYRKPTQRALFTQPAKEGGKAYDDPSYSYDDCTLDLTGGTAAAWNLSTIADLECPFCGCTKEGAHLYGCTGEAPPCDCLVWDRRDPACNQHKKTKRKTRRSRAQGAAA